MWILSAISIALSLSAAEQNCREGERDLANEAGMLYSELRNSKYYNLVVKDSALNANCEKALGRPAFVHVIVAV